MKSELGEGCYEEVCEIRQETWSPKDMNLGVAVPVSVDRLCVGLMISVPFLRSACHLRL